MATIDISLKDLLKDKTHPEAGAEVFKVAQKAILNDDKVSIDMEDIVAVPTSFMNTSFGDLINVFGFNETRRVFYFKNIRKTQLERFRKYFNDYHVMIKNNQESNDISPDTNG